MKMPGSTRRRVISAIMIGAGGVAVAGIAGSAGVCILRHLEKQEEKQRVIAYERVMQEDLEAREEMVGSFIGKVLGSYASSLELLENYGVVFEQGIDKSQLAKMETPRFQRIGPIKDFDSLFRGDETRIVGLLYDADADGRNDIIYNGEGDISDKRAFRPRPRFLKRGNADGSFGNTQLIEEQAYAKILARALADIYSKGRNDSTTKPINPKFF